MIPHDHEAVAIEVTPRHLVLLRTVPLLWEYNHIDVISKNLEARIGFTDCLEKSDVTWVAARVLSDHDVSG